MSHKGYKQTEEHKENIRKSLIGRKFSESWKKKIGISNTGKKRSLEVRKKISERMKGHISPKKGIKGVFHHSEYTKKTMNLWRKGIKRPSFSIEWRKKMSESNLLSKKRTYKNTSIELKMKSLLDKLEVEYLFQHPLEKIAVVDFYIPSKKLVIQCDGCFWHACPIHYPNSNVDVKIRNEKQDKKLRELGYRIIRFWEHEILNLNVLDVNKVID